MNVYERTQRRLKTVFDLFDNIYVSFSGGKDSGVLLNLCIDYIRRHGLRRRIGVFHMDYEIQYRDTLDYVDRTLDEFGNEGFVLLQNETNLVGAIIEKAAGNQCDRADGICHREHDGQAARRQRAAGKPV